MPERPRLVALINPHAHQLVRRPLLVEQLAARCERVASTERSEQTPEAVERLLSDAPDALLVAGGDATLGRVADALANRGDATPIIPLPLGALNFTCRRLRVSSLRRAMAVVLHKPADLTRREVTTLRVSSSLQDRARHGFCLGLGEAFELLEGAARLGGCWRHLAMVAAARTLQHTAPFAFTLRDVDRVESLQARALWMTADTSRGALALRYASNALPTTLAAALSARLSPETLDRVTTRDAAQGLSISLETGGHTLDGELYPASKAHALSVSVGPLRPMLIA